MIYYGLARSRRATVRPPFFRLAPCQHTRYFCITLCDEGRRPGNRPNKSLDDRCARIHRWNLQTGWRAGRQDSRLSYRSGTAAKRDREPILANGLMRPCPKKRKEKNPPQEIQEILAVCQSLCFGLCASIPSREHDTLTESLFLFFKRSAAEFFARHHISKQCSGVGILHYYLRTPMRIYHALAGAE